MKNLGACAFCAVLALSARAQNTGWEHYGGDAGGTRYSNLHQIDRKNVSRLKVAWTYHTGALNPESRLNAKAAFEATPVLIDGSLYLSTPFDQVIALDPATGAERWKYDPDIDRSKPYSEVTSRGVAAWHDPKGGWRLFLGTIDGRLIALDARTGQPATEFGLQGEVDLTRGVDLRSAGDYQVTSPPAVAGDVVVVGSSIGDNRAVSLERGVVRAYDARTGALRWTWDPIPWGARTRPRTGAANAWSILSVDPRLGLVFVPTGSASPDFYGGIRPGDGKWADSVVALRTATGELAWGFQVVHHDLWDFDVASQPVLFEFRGKTPAVAVTTKMGNVFVLDRATGKPLLPVEERPVPASDVPGEKASPTQPFSSIPPLVPQRITEADAWGATPEEREACRKKIAALRHDGPFAPPSIAGTLQVPGNAGGVNWGSAAVDTSRGILFANSNHLPFLVRLIPRQQLSAELEKGHNRLHGEYGRQEGAPYAMYREPLMSARRLPCVAPPWGTLTAVDLNRGTILWQVPLGSLLEHSASGSINLGGPIVTAGGLVFDAASMDGALRAFDADTGKELWTTVLPFPAQATPMTYMVGNRQYVVICAGGHGKLGTPRGDSVIAFALP